MPASQLVSAQHGIIAWWKIADGGAARLAVLIAILVRRSMEPTGHGAASNTGLVTRIPRGVIEFCFASSGGKWHMAVGSFISGCSGLSRRDHDSSG